MFVLSPQCSENTAFFSGFPLVGNHGQGIFPVIPLELQGKKHQPFSITQPLQMIIPIFERCHIFLQPSSIMGKMQHSLNTP